MFLYKFANRCLMFPHKIQPNRRNLNSEQCCCDFAIFKYGDSIIGTLKTC